MSLTLLISTKHHLWLGPNQSTWPNVVAHPISDRFAVNRAYWSPIFDPDSPTVNNPVFRTVLETLSNPLTASSSGTTRVLPKRLNSSELKKISEQKTSESIDAGDGAAALQVMKTVAAAVEVA